jgi:hypothetical protein
LLARTAADRDRGCPVSLIEINLIEINLIEINMARRGCWTTPGSVLITGKSDELSFLGVSA